MTAPMNTCDGCSRPSPMLRRLDTDKGPMRYCPACEAAPDPLCLDCRDPLSLHTGDKRANIWAACKGFKS